MNIVDLVILGIIGLSLLVGLYRGFIASVASMGGCLVSLLLSFWLSPQLVSWIQSNPDLIRNLMSYTDASSRLGDLNLSLTNVSQLTENGISEILSRVSLPAPLDTLLKTNLEQQVFAPSGLTQVGDYVSQTIVGAVLNVISFLVCFVVLLIAFHIVINLLKVIFKFPVLKQLNSLAGGAFGILRGVLFCYVAFALLPLIQTTVPIEGISEMVEASALAPIFNSGNLILAIMNGKL